MQFSTAAFALLSASAVGALQVAPASGLTIRRAAAPASTSPVMGEQSTRRQNEWKFVQGVNDAGKEQTYMYLAEREGSEEDFMGTPIFGEEALGGFSFLGKPYFIALFTPLLLAILAVVTGLN